MPANQFSDVIARLLADDPGRPRVTFYGPDYERVELSAKTLDNWVSKTANLLVDELDAGPGSRIGLALPAHWRSVVWLLATWTVGAHALVFDSAGEPVDVLVTDKPSNPPSGTEETLLVVQPLAALATRFTGDVPSGAIDAASETRLQPDHFPGSPAPAPSDPAFSAGGQPVAYADLVRPADGPVRLLTGAGPAHALTDYLAPLAAGGSIVIHHDLAALDRAAIDHLSDQEQVTRK